MNMSISKRTFFFLIRDNDRPFSGQNAQSILQPLPMYFSLNCDTIHCENSNFDVSRLPS